MLRLLLLVSVMIAFLLVQSGFTVYADETPGGNISDPVVRAVDVAEPAVVRILTQVAGKLAVNFPGGPSVTFPQNGSSYPITLSGSGTFISAHGDILTADHVVNPPHDQELNNALDVTASQDIATYVNQHSQPNSGQATADQVTQALETGQLPSTPQYGTTQSAAFFSTAYTGPLSATSFQNIPSSVQMTVDSIKKQSPVNQRDTAIIHVAMNDTPSVTVGSSANVQQQDNLTIVGFPGNADVSNKPTDILTPSINKVIVSATKTTDTGAPVIQVGGNVEQGDSGGPALNSTGNIVGIVSFSIAGNNSPGSTNFLQAGESAQQLIQSLNLDTTPGVFQKEWSQAFADYSSTAPGHWHKAQSELQKIQDSYPQFKAIAPYLNYAAQQAKNESSVGGLSTSTGISPLILGIIVLVILALLALLAFALLRRRKPVVATSAGNGAIGANNFNAGVMSTTGYLPQMPQGQGRSLNVPNVSPSGSAYGNSVGAFGGPPQATFGMQDTTSQPMSQQQGIPQSYPQQLSYPAYPPYRGQPVQPSSLVQQPQPTPGFGQSMPVPLGATGIPGTRGVANANGTDVLRPWPCGHLNRSNARFCSVCGGPSPQQAAPSAPTVPGSIPPGQQQQVRRYEQ